jgi:DNA replication protein DnaC
MVKSAPDCLRCNGTRIFISVRPRERYAHARLCDCVAMPCKTCKNTRFIVEQDSYQRDVAIVCPDCEQIKQRVQLYNNARIPRRYLNSRLSEQDRDAENEMVFDLLGSIFRLLPQRLSNRNLLETDSEDLKGMVLMGPPGTGKTHLMTGFAYQCTISHGISCIFQSFAELLSELRQGYSDGKSDMEIIDPHLQTDILIIDDMGKGRNSDWELSILDMLISERYNRNQIIMVSTNFTESEENTLKEKIRNREKTESEIYIADTIRGRVGERIHSRLKEMCYFENLLGQDRRIGEDELDD